MDFLKSQFDRIQQQLNGLTPSQKMLTGTLVTIMVMTLVWWGKFAGQAEMEPLLSQPLTDEEVTQVTNLLDIQGIPFKVSDDKKVLVSRDNRIRAVSLITYGDALPKTTGKANGFDEIIKQMTPWDGQDRQNLMFNRAKEITLSEVIRHFPDVAAATVAIDPTRQRDITRGDVVPTAFVNITMKNGAKGGNKLVKAAASLVTGAQAGLAMKNVKVVVDGVTHRVRDADPDDAGAEDLFEIRQREEMLLTQKLVGQYGEIQNLLVAVTVDVEHKSGESRINAVDGVLQKESMTTEDAQESVGAVAPVAEPGATPNVGVAASNGSAQIQNAAGGGTGGTQTQTNSKVQYSLFPTTREERLKTPAGKASVVGVNLRVPRSHFVRIVKGRGTAEPSDAAVDARIEKEIADIRKSVATWINIRDPRSVTVDPYFDMPMALEQPAVASSPVSLALGGHTKEIALGALALVSLFLVSTIVKKGMPVPAPAARATAAAAPNGPPPVLSSGETLAGEAGEGNPLLDGMELDDDAVRTQQMLSQVSTMVDDNPDAAAALVKRWLNRS